MSGRLDIQQCRQCGLVVEVLRDGGSELRCCGRVMDRLPEKSFAAGRQRHIPLFELVGERLRVTVGQPPHEMGHGHCLQWIEVIADGRSYRQFLRPGLLPQATFELATHTIDDAYVRLMCSQHGLWTSSTPLLLAGRLVSA